MDRILEHVQDLILAAKRKNLDAYEIEASLDRGFSAQARQGLAENLSHHRERSIQITVYMGQKTGNASTSDFSTKALTETLEKACTIAKFTEPDSFVGLADRELIAFDYPDLNLNYPWSISHSEVIDLAILCDETARGIDPKITQTIDANVSTNSHTKVYANSFDFFGDYSTTMHGMSISVLAEDNGQMERDYDYCFERDAKHLLKPEDIAKQAAMRALARLNARKVKQGQYPVIFEARVASSLISHLIAAISGSNLYRKSSFLLDQLGSQIFPSFITIEQHPHIKGGYGSAPFDDQGVKTKDISFIEHGVLKNYVLGAYSARKLGMISTGNSGGVYNLRMSHSDKSLKDLCQQMDTGLLVTELMGQGINLLTGDYSRGAAGFWVENGEIQYPVNETTIASNLKDMFSNLIAVGNDIDTKGNVYAGSIFIESMMVA